MIINSLPSSKLFYLFYCGFIYFYIVPFLIDHGKEPWASPSAEERWVRNLLNKYISGGEER